MNGNPAEPEGTNMALSETARAALAQCYATRGRHKGQLLARCPAQYGPKANPSAAAAWQGAMLVCNPYKAGICTLMFMKPEHRAIQQEITAHFEAMPREYRNMADRDREALEALGVW
jgi:hypothetical protein